jgi:hypothetical protein
MAVDIVRNRGEYLRLVGMAANPSRVFATALSGSEKGAREIVVVPGDLVYRADILGRAAGLAECGSPAFEISNLVPGDIVEVSGKKVTFRGLTDGGTFFVDEENGRVHRATFAPLVMVDAFKVVSRVAFGQ